MQEIADYTVLNFGAERARAYGQGIETCFQTLCDTPLIGRAFDHIRPGLRRYDYKSHSIFYLPHADQQLIVRVLHMRQDSSRHL